MSDMLSQEEIDALLSGSGMDTSPSEDETFDFTEIEKDAIGEIGNISMGTSATTLSTLLGHKVTITTPRVSIITMQDLSEQYPMPFVAVDVRYKEGIQGMNLLIIKVDDVKIITDLMMGGSGTVSSDPLSELHLSAISEAMNQMVGSSSTSLSEMFSKKIDIHPPRAFEIDLQSDDVHETFADDQEQLVKISFKMEIEGLIDSEIMQLIPIDFAKEMVELLMPTSEVADTKQPSPQKEVNQVNSVSNDNHDEIHNLMMHTSHSNEAYEERPEENQQSQKNAKVNVQPVQFQAFDQESYKGMPENIALIQDVPLKVTVELGRTVKRVNEVLEFGPGTIIELDKLVGEPLDILVNGQYVAKGEVVVMDENYGIRITDIVNPNKRFAKL
ncbi:flagellar motor switch protein FliN/FliY [Anaerovirgula multivorans]|uniref:Flagellar motor switch protein FliN/FliY n=1 Tax=Anaerovirgula multivorans TaxID=312168 RepID=A0A239A1U7_9FIRM|nr:flagellar motor switch phosphatase FliY [Anaerovirgula multivorans]SNR89625.1 flagellar motor switch protein FliN/FliY [Anaerovirgula multivorans]